MQDAERKRWEPRYSLVLVGVALFHLSLILVDRLLEIRLFDGTLMFPQIGSHLAMSALSTILLGAALARHQEAASAGGLTILASAIAALLWPVGTASFVYWVGWVRRRERAV